MDEFKDLLPEDWSTVSLSDFCQLPIKRTEDQAEIIIAYYLGTNPETPCRLIGFSTQAHKSDFDVYEEAFGYFTHLTEELRNIKD